MATLNSGGIYLVQPTDQNIFVRTGQPVTIIAESSPALERSFRVYAVVPNGGIMMNFSPNTLAKFGPNYTFGPGLDAIGFVWDGVAWNAF